MVIDINCETPTTPQRYVVMNVHKYINKTQLFMKCDTIIHIGIILRKIRLQKNKRHKVLLLWLDMVHAKYITPQFI